MKKPSAKSQQYVSLADEIQAKYEKNPLANNKMPSVREMAKEFGASSVTISRAIQELGARGFLETRPRSGCYRLAPPDAPRIAVVQNLTPGSWLPLTEALIRRGFKSYIEAGTAEFHWDAFKIEAGLTIEAATESAQQAVSNRFQGVMLLPNRTSDALMRAEEHFLAGCKKVGLPVVLMERNLRGVDRPLETDLVRIEDCGGGMKAASHLIETGRRRIGMIISSPTTSHRYRLAGFLSAIEDARTRGQIPPDTQAPVLYHTLTENSASDYMKLAQEIIHHQLDGIVCYADYVATGVMLALLRNGVHVPHQIGMVGFDNLTVGDYFQGGLTSIDYPSERLVREAMRVLEWRLENPLATPVQVLVTVDLIKRGSTARPEAGGNS
jgi:LacI family transcriptional regulator